jgi:hypothetical protein
MEKPPIILSTVGVLLVGAVTMSFGESASPAANPADVTAIRALYQRMMDGWNKGSGEAFAAVFAEDGEQVAFDRTHFQGVRKSPRLTSSSLAHFLRAAASLERSNTCGFDPLKDGEGSMWAAALVVVVGFEGGWVCRAQLHY